MHNYGTAVTNLRRRQSHIAIGKQLPREKKNTKAVAKITRNVFFMFTIRSLPSMHFTIFPNTDYSHHSIAQMLVWPDKTLFVEDGKLVHYRLPIMRDMSPASRDVTQGQPDKYSKLRVVRRSSDGRRRHNQKGKRTLVEAALCRTYQWPDWRRSAGATPTCCASGSRST
ncbi:hypothetical protein [Burkholderia gladioli]|uniref:hypothetical protein n=1 Tax=Burkholderia gladioli TaxID=28095 RepID=UPI001D0F67B7|nr:hypothetical protein [Burkholderia gladioli]MDN8060610.1 hypothetical protein [Burkholderia gladioli]